MAGSQEKSNMSHIATLLNDNFAVDSQQSDHSAWQKRNLQQVTAAGLPNPKDEDWKYTSLAQLQQTVLFEDKRSEFDQKELAQLTLVTDSYTVVFVDGMFQANLSDTDLGLWEISVIANENISGEAAIQTDVFALLTEGLTKQQVKFNLPANCLETKPLYLMHINTSYCGGMAFYYHNITLGDNSQAKVIEHHVASENTVTNKEKAKDLYGSRLVMRVGNKSKLEHLNFITGHHQTQHFSHNDILVGRDSDVQSDSFLLSGGLIRHNTSASLQYENSRITLNSLALPVAKQNYDNRTFLHHQAPHCDSMQLHKNIVQDQAMAVFNGMIKVSPQALKTDGKMNNHNLLLSEKAQVNSKPQLEIYADDVKCGHGCTTGALNQNQLFYLMARGINKQQALRTLVYAFAAEMLENSNLGNVSAALYALIETKLEMA